MKATLTTRCGCSRSMNVTFPAPPIIILPLYPDPFRSIDWLNPDTSFTPNKAVYSHRRFQLCAHKSYRLDSPMGQAQYIEAE